MSLFDIVGNFGNGILDAFSTAGKGVIKTVTDTGKKVEQTLTDTSKQIEPTATDLLGKAGDILSGTISVAKNGGEKLVDSIKNAMPKKETTEETPSKDEQSQATKINDKGQEMV